MESSEKIVKPWDFMNTKQFLIERFLRDLQVETSGEIKFLSTIEILAEEMLKDIEMELLAIADAGEYEELRREVTYYFE